jgi:NADH-quinone oxidoreductase subunit J
MNGQLIFFAVMAALSIVCAIGMIVTDNPVRSSLYLVLVLFSVALLFVALHATFLAAIQIIVYAGAIMVLFIFVIMLLNLGTPERTVDHLRAQKWVAPLLGAIVVALLASVIMALPAKMTLLPPQLDGALEIGKGLFQPTWLFPFEAVSILLLVAAIGAIMLAKKRV